MSAVAPIRVRLRFHLQPGPRFSAGKSCFQQEMRKPAAPPARPGIPR